MFSGGAAGGRLRATATAATNALARSAGRLPIHAASISLTRTVWAARWACSYFDRFVMDCLAGWLLPCAVAEMKTTARSRERAVGSSLGQAAVTFFARAPFGLCSISNSTFSPPERRSEVREEVRPSRWEKYFVPASPEMKPQ